MEHIAQSRFGEGVAELERAYEILPHPAVLYNIGRAWRDAGELEKSLEAFRRYLATDPEDRAEIEAAISNLEARIADSKATPAEPPDKPDEGPSGEGGAAPAPVPKEAPPDDRGPDLAEGEKGLYEETVVTASRRAQSPLDSPNSTTIVTRQDIRLSGITRIPELLRRVAGMDVMQITGGDANVSMRGLNSRLSNKLLVQVDGRTVKNEVLGSTFWESLSIDVDQIERIEVVRGPGSSLYGADAFAGVVNIITVPPGEGGVGFRAGGGDGPQGYGSVWASQRDGDFAYRASAGYTRYPRWTREVAPGRVDLQIADIDQDLGSQNARVDGRVTYRVDSDKQLLIGGGFSRTDLEIYGIGPFNDYYVQLDNSDVTAGFDTSWLNIRTSYILLQARASQNHDYVGHTLYETDPTQHKLIANVSLKYTFEWPSGLQQALLGGVNYQLKNIDWNYLVEEPPIEHHVGIFLQDALSFAEHYSVVLSGRLDYVPFLQTVVPSGRASFLVRPGETKRQLIRASVGTAFRSPTFLESYLDIPIQLSLQGLEVESSTARPDDPDFQLGAENILAAELGYVNQLSDDFQMEIAAYYHRINDFIVLADVRQLSLSNLGAGGTTFDPETGRFNVGFGGWENQCSIDHVFGGEVGGRYYGVEGLDIFANYAINYGLQELPEGCVVPKDQKTSHHKINVGTQLRTSFGLEGEISFHYQTSQVWGEQVATLDGIQLQLFDLPDYHLLNGRIGFAFLEQKRAHVAVTVYNALADVFGDPPQQHPFGSRVGRRFMGFLGYRL
ncbi:MAG: TonB-dependent receptor [Myxococcales bacterium]|nr:TonB-dependent receptor [Myxococcales bacterium]